MILNLLHRPETGERYELYRLQQQYAHRLKLKVTLMISVQALEDERLVQDILKDHREFGDELALWLWSFERPELGGSAPFWLISRKNKRKGLQYASRLFQSRLGCSPVSVGSYVLDAPSMELIREICPEVTTVIAGCFEEGTKVFHGCNHSWYLFSEGMPWGPWYPAKGHAFRPAPDTEDWSGLVAVPHLSRDLALAYEGRNDFFASHPANVQRGLANKGLLHEYDYNLIDQYRMQEDYNDGFSFYHVHVSASWLGNSPNVQDPPEVSQRIYLETLKYLASLRNQGSVQDMHMSEFGAWYSNSVPLGKPAVAVGKEMLYGSGKHYFWFSDPYFRILIDAAQGGSIGDIRPYAGKFESFTGPDSPFREIATYPYLIQSQLRTGTVHHFADGSRTTLYLSDGAETVGLCECKVRVASVRRAGASVEMRLTSADIRFHSGLAVQLETVYEFIGSGKLLIKRKLAFISGEPARLHIREYFKGCYGFTEYAEDLRGIELEAVGEAGEESRETLTYLYESRSMSLPKGRRVSASIPQIGTQVSLEPMNMEPETVGAEEGHLFNPYFTLKVEYAIDQDNKEAVTCLSIQKLR